MIIYELVGREDHPAYEKLEQENGERHYNFLRSIVESALELGKPFISTTILKALNYHAISCLHLSAGEFRPCQVSVGNGIDPPDFLPVAHYRVQAQMDDFVNTVNREWANADPISLAAYVLWRLNHIHPFINGNGRTARAACYFVLCVHVGTWLPGKTILPELLKRRDRNLYVAALKKVDDSLLKTGSVDVSPLHELLNNLLTEQFSEVNAVVEEQEEILA